MALSDIKKAIIEEADNQAKAILKEGESQVLIAQKEWGKKIAEKKALLLDRAKKKAQQKVRQERFAAKARSHAGILSKKREVIEQVYAAVADKLANLTSEEHAALMKKLVANLPIKSGELVVAKKQADTLKKALGVKAGQYKLKVEDMSGGFIARSGGLQLNYSFEALVANSKEQTEIEVAEYLFGSN